MNTPSQLIFTEQELKLFADKIQEIVLDDTSVGMDFAKDETIVEPDFSLIDKNKLEYIKSILESKSTPDLGDAEAILRQHVKPHWLVSGDSGKAMVAAMHSYASSLKEEVEKLRGLLEKLWLSNYQLRYGGSGLNTDSWKQFCETNNL